jgi:DNA (cytosine-5)-methyltransferase 1
MEKRRKYGRNVVEFKLGELFCGPGGLAFGAQKAVVNKNGEFYGVKHVWANDIDENACETYRNNIAIDPTYVYAKPVKDLDIENLSEIDAFAYGFPCNDFSIVGEKNGFEGIYGPLYTYGVKVLNRFKPKWFFAENVGGLQSADEGSTFERILRDFSRAGDGYQLTVHLYKFEEYGVPQTRHRIIIIGLRKDLGLTYKVPARTTPDPKDWKTAKEAIEMPPISIDAKNNELTIHPKSTIERLQHIPSGKNAWYQDIPEKYKLNVKGARLSQIYRRLQPDEPSYTVTGSGGGGTHVYHWEEPRALTNRERARLQTFPDTFVFQGKKESVRKQIGMAVPPEGVRIIIEAVLKTFAGIEYKSENPKWKISDIIKVHDSVL